MVGKIMFCQCEQIIVRYVRRLVFLLSESHSRLGVLEEN